MLSLVFGVFCIVFGIALIALGVTGLYVTWYKPKRKA